MADAAVPARFLLACILALALIGVVAGIAAAPPGAAVAALGLHSLHLSLGLAAFLAGYAAPSERVRRLAPGLLALVFALLALMLASEGVGRSANGAERWLSIGGFQFQPSALLQCLWPVALAGWAARDPLRLSLGRELAKLMLLFGLLVTPVLLQPDLGSVLILLAVTGIALFFAGAPVQFLRLLVPVCVAALMLAAFLFDHVHSRLEDFLQGEVPYQTLRAEQAFAVGGLEGTGPGAGLLQHGFVPEGDTDFILALIGEEWGFPGTLAVWLLFIAFTVLGVKVASRAESRYGAILMATATLMVAVQAALNMAVVTGAVPPKGLPLPFVSRGGSSILALSALLGIALRAALQRRPVPSSQPAHHPWNASNALVSSPWSSSSESPRSAS
ncbi:MAG: hypothetical protein EYC70_14675 [Planctomycetota bacterium]|nr:MAG: hypothetical protein EYC70_14675 [Planctomycetota bacterium]